MDGVIDSVDMSLSKLQEMAKDGELWRAGEGNGNPLQYSFLENSMDRGAWQATVHGVTESDWTEQMSTYTY